MTEREKIAVNALHAILRASNCDDAYDITKEALRDFDAWEPIDTKKPITFGDSRICAYCRAAGCNGKCQEPENELRFELIDKLPPTQVSKDTYTESLEANKINELIDAVHHLQEIVFRRIGEV